MRQCVNFSNEMATIPETLLEFARVFIISNYHQFTCLLNTIDNRQLKIIVELIYNLLYNTTISLTKTQKGKLKKYKNTYITIADNTKSLKLKKVLITKHPGAIKTALVVIAEIHGRL